MGFVPKSLCWAQCAFLICQVAETILEALLNIKRERPRPRSLHCIWWWDALWL